MVLVGASQVTVAPAGLAATAATADEGRGGGGGGGGHFIAADALYAISSRGVTVTAMAAAQLAILLENELHVRHQ